MIKIIQLNPAISNRQGKRKIQLNPANLNRQGKRKIVRNIASSK